MTRSIDVVKSELRRILCEFVETEKININLSTSTIELECCVEKFRDDVKTKHPSLFAEAQKFATHKRDLFAVAVYDHASDLVRNIMMPMVQQCLALEENE